MTLQEAIEAIREKYPQLNPVPASEFYSRPSAGIWFRQEGATIDGVPVHDEYNENEELYRLGVLVEVEDFLESLGYYSEPYDTGTLMAYPTDPKAYANENKM